MADEQSLPEGAIPVLDKGFVRLVDHMGGDEAIVQAARVSYGKGTKKVSQDKGLIRYLMRHRHTTPFEMVDFKWHAKMPILVARQWVRHRTASINEYSLRYSEARDDFYIPDPDAIRSQSEVNKQGRSDKELPKELIEKVRENFLENSSRAFQLYQEMNDAGIAKELARGVLPVNIYTEWYWKNDLHNTFHFLNLRMDKHAQWEIQQYANAMAGIIKEKVPIAYGAFEDYILNGTNLTKPDLSVLTKRVPNLVMKELREDVDYMIVATLNQQKHRENGELYSLYQKEGGKDSEDIFWIKWNHGDLDTGNVRELREFREKLEKINLSSQS